MNRFRFDKRYILGFARLVPVLTAVVLFIGGIVQAFFDSAESGEQEIDLYGWHGALLLTAVIHSIYNLCISLQFNRDISDSSRPSLTLVLSSAWYHVAIEIVLNVLTLLLFAFLVCEQWASLKMKTHCENGFFPNALSCLFTTNSGISMTSKIARGVFGAIVLVLFFINGISAITFFYIWVVGRWRAADSYDDDSTFNERTESITLLRSLNESMDLERKARLSREGQHVIPENVLRDGFARERKTSSIASALSSGGGRDIDVTLVLQQQNIDTDAKPEAVAPLMFVEYPTLSHGGK